MDSTINIRLNADNVGAQKVKSTIDSIAASFDKLLGVVDKTLSKFAKTIDAKNKYSGAGINKKDEAGASIMGRILGGFDPKGPERAMATTSQNISKFVDKSVRDLDRLKAAQDKVYNEYKGNAVGTNRLFDSVHGNYTGIGLGGATGLVRPGLVGADGGWSYDIASKINLPGGHPQSNPASSFEAYLKSKTPWEKFLGPYAGRSFWGEGGFEGYMQGRGAAFGQALGLGAPGATVFGALGGAVGKMGPYGAAAVGGAWLANKSFEAFDELRPNQVQYTLDKRFLELGAGRAIAGTHSKVFNSIQGGNLSYLGGYQSALADPEVRKSLRNEVLNQESLMAIAKLMPNSLSGKVSLWGSQLKNGATIGVGAFMQMIEGQQLETADTRNARELVYQRAAFNLVGKKQENLQAAAEAHTMFQGGYFNTMTDRIKNDSYSRVNAMRARGLDMSPGPNGEMAYEKWRSRLIAGGWDAQDDIQGYQALLGVGKGYGKVLSTTWGVVGGHMAGLGNIEHIVAAAGVAGGTVSRAGQLKDILQGSTGRGGLDVTVANKLFMDTLNSVNQTGMWGTGNTVNGYASIAAGIVGGGYDDNGRLMYDVAGQQRRMAGLAGGNKLLQEFTTGTAAPIYGTMSLYAGIEANGGKWGLGVEALRSKDPRELASLVKGGQVSDYDLFTIGDGSTPEGKERIQTMSQKFLSKGLKNIFGQVNPDALDRPEARKFLEDIQYAYAHGGTFNDVLEDRTWNITDKRKKAESQARLRRGAAGILQAFNKKGTNQDWEMLLEAGSEYQSKDWGLYVKGKGAGVGAPKGLEAKALKADAERLNTESLLGGLSVVGENTAKIAALLEAQNKALGIADVGQRAVGKVKTAKDPKDKEGVPEDLLRPGAEGAWGNGPAAAVPLGSKDADPYLGFE